MRVQFFARCTPWHPNPDGLLKRPVLQNGRKHLRLKHFKSIGVSEKASHMDQDVLVQGLDFSRMALQEVHVLFHLLYSVQSHPAQNAPLNSGGLVIGKINLVCHSQRQEDVFEMRIAVGHQFGGF